MASYTIRVNFNVVNSVAEIEVDPDSLEVLPPPTGASPSNDITWVRGNYDPSTNPWTFSAMTFTETEPFAQLLISGNAISVIDFNQGLATKEFEYTIQVEQAGKLYSLDPQIVNKGGTG